MTKQKVRKITFQQRRKEIAKLIQQVGIWNINKSSLSRKYEVERNVIINDINHIMEHLNIIDAESIQFELHRFYKEAVKDCWREYKRTQKPVYNKKGELKEMKDVPASIRQKWLDRAYVGARDITKFLEAYGIKDPIMLNANDDVHIDLDEWVAYVKARQQKEENEL